MTGALQNVNDRKEAEMGQPRKQKGGDGRDYRTGGGYRDVSTHECQARRKVREIRQIVLKDDRGHARLFKT